jgi:hypothetical protein
MSYDIDLLDPVTKQTIRFDAVHHIKGGNYVLGGTDEASLNVTYNYSKHFCRVFEEFEDPTRLEKKLFGIRILDGRTGAESIPILRKAISTLGDDVDEDYWKATEGNAKAALYGLLAFAQMRPDGVWEVR